MQRFMRTTFPLLTCETTKLQHPHILVFEETYALRSF